MRTIRIMLALAVFIPVIACSAQTEKKDIKTGSADKVEAYYFHFTARCMTCKTVEAQAKLNIETLYTEQVKQGKISFQSVNLDEESGKALAEKLKVYGQTLLVVKGDKQIILTNEGFMYAVREPEKFKAIMKEKIDSLM
ncbi:MAG: hypothetical protein JW973_01235 [Bacteroidales bacterium]|nr:hypothetical protein [Bacteroidales bacterium]